MSAGDPIPLPDADARRRAATDFETNLVVLAGAGTGKTSLLVERALVAIGSEIAPISKLAAITFTDKAAGEMRQRLALGLDRLRALARGEPVGDGLHEADRAFAFLTERERVPREQIARLALAALEELDRASVMTIHGFCSQLLREHPLEAGVDPLFQVDSGEHAEALSRTCWEEFVTRELGPRARRSDVWRRLLARLELSEIGEVARRLAGFRVPASLLDAPFPDARELLGEEPATLVSEIDALIEAQSGLTPSTLAYFRSARCVLDALSRKGLGAFREAIDSDPALMRKVTGRNPPRPGSKLQGVSAEKFKTIVSGSSSLLRGLCKVDDALAALLIEVVAPFVAEFREAYLRQGHLSFDGLLALTRDLLRDHREVRRALKRRYRLIMVDEFQDTDPLQHEIVLFLAERPEESCASAHLAGLDPGRLFVVGDAKQSVYRFRGADYSAYRRAVERIAACGGERLHLVTNFRSLRGVIEPVNRLFGARESCWIASDYQPDYVPIAPVREEEHRAGGPPVELWTVELKEGALAEERREAEGRLIAEEIERLVESGSCGHAEITILFRAFTRISHYLRPLRQRGIPFVVDGGRDFLERPEVGQLMATLRTLAQPGDPAALLAFLRSPAGGIPDTELQAFAMGGGRWDWRIRPSVEGCCSIAGRFEFLRDLSLETRHLPADAVVRRVVERAHLLPLGAAAFEGAQRVANLRKLSAGAGELARDGRFSLDQVVEALRAGRIANLETDPPLTDDTSQAVRITSIHRMKGLENRWIILPDLARQDVRRSGEGIEVSVARRPDGDPALALSVSGITNTAEIWLERENRLHARAEETRVLYVALTRARDRLVVVAGRPRREAPWISALAPWGYAAKHPPVDGALLAEGRVLHRRLEPAATPRRRALPELDEARQAVREYEAARQSLRERARPPFVAPSALGEEETVEPAVGRSVARRIAAGRAVGKAVGIVIHRILASGSVEPAALTGMLGSTAAAVAGDLGIDATALGAEAGGILEAFLQSPLARVFRDVATIGREVPLLLREDDGRIYRGSIDLLYQDGGGGPVVADYKTDREMDEAKLQIAYRDQLRIYARAVQQAFDLPGPPRAELWLLRSGRRVVVPQTSRS